MKVNPDNILKCKFCKWQTPRWVTTKKGKRVNKSSKLVGHVMIEHPDEYSKIMEETSGD